MLARTAGRVKGRCQIRVTILTVDSGHDSSKKNRQLEKDLLKAREVEKALKRELQDLNAKNEAAKEKVNEIKHAIQVMFVVVCAIMITFSFYSISDAI